MKVISLFANIGVAEAYLDEIGVNVVLANEFVPRRAKLYSDIYPQTEMLCGDFTDPIVYSALVKRSKELKIDIVLATPPCQGMSTAGKQRDGDKRNNLIVSTIDFIKEVKPLYGFIENVALFLKTSVIKGGKKISIPRLIESELGDEYDITFDIINTKDYGVAQSRTRAIVLLSKKNKKWVMPKPFGQIKNLKDVIGHLPPIDPYIKDVNKKGVKS